MSRQNYTPVAIIISTLFSTNIFAETQLQQTSAADDIVISASRVETKRVETGSSITVLDEKYIKDSQAITVEDLLRQVPGVSVASNGGMGSLTSVFIRGAESNHTLVVIDGVEVNDISSVTGGYNFANLMAANIERIEVLKGAQSALWGSDAMGGVINIVTKKGETGFNPSASIERGTQDHLSANVNVNGATEKSHYSFSYSNLSTDGINATTADTRTGGDELDGFKNETVAIKAGHQVNKTLSFDGVMRISDSSSEFDDSYNQEDGLSNNRQRLAKINTNIDLLDNRWTTRVGIAYSDTDSESLQDSYDPYVSDGQKVKLDLQSNYQFEIVADYSQRITFVAETERDEYRNSYYPELQEMQNTGLVLDYGMDWAKTIFANAAIRHDFNDTFDDTTTYHIDTSAWISDGTRLHASAGTGVRNPTFSQLNGNNPGWGYVGNPDLEPESSKTWDIGAEYNFASFDGYLDITYFDAKFTDLHEYIYSPDTFLSTYENVEGESTSKGVEVVFSSNITQDWRLNAHYTYNETDDGGDEGNSLIRRPDHSAGVQSNYQLTAKLNSNLGVNYVGKRLDSGDVILDAYTLVNIGANYEVNEHFSVYGRIENAFDTEYVEVVGYNTEPVTAYLGVTIK